ncbi:DegT/DnrJ/EryC1/StrS family aminotransferase [Mesoterricola silvestris]|uniref:3-oxo-glucose-6-phosphate:glutamate aminotransferase n=1 Tax=Mesoterricola silvestris TaxID=2927979 RepID=A0AA48K9U2_9BACT|nr:aminotransferase class I/II-fold pyridoxal phosphate-dependent enzyme [Mesoterricola silvestris]BDU73430.1 3-oxo-glucose-6-phosphate:glutamate aminotransferase [Mesoterricola silvestris]
MINCRNLQQPGAKTIREGETKFHLRGDSVDNVRLLEMLLEGTEGEVSIDPNRAMIKLAETLLSGGRLRRDMDLAQVLFAQTPPTDQVPFLPMHRLMGAEETKACQEAFALVADSGQFTSGPHAPRLEEALCEFLGCRATILCSSGTDALIVVLHALGIGSGDEVIIPGNSFAATENAILAVGAVPVLGDVEEATFLLDASKLERVVTARTRLILPVHLYGQLADMPKIRRVSDSLGVRLLEDACQSLGATGMGRHSDAAVLSFNPFKNLGFCGKARAIVTQDPALETRCRMISYHGFELGKKNIKTEGFGFNARIDDLQAAIGWAKLPYLALNNFRRLFLAWRYLILLKDLVRSGKILAPSMVDRHVWHLFPVQILDRDRDQVRRDLLERHHVETEIYYPRLTHQQDTPLQKTYYSDTRCPVTEKLHQRLMNLPLYPGMTLGEQDRVVEAMEMVLAKPAPNREKARSS